MIQFVVSFVPFFFLLCRLARTDHFVSFSICVRVFPSGSVAKRAAIPVPLIRHINFTWEGAHGPSTLALLNMSALFVQGVD